MADKVALVQAFIEATADLIGAIAEAPFVPDSILRSADKLADSVDALKSAGVFQLVPVVPPGEPDDGGFLP